MIFLSIDLNRPQQIFHLLIITTQHILIHLTITNFKLLELFKIVSTSRFIDNFFIVLVDKLSVIDGVGALDALGDVVVEFVEEGGLVLLDGLGDFACV